MASEINSNIAGGVDGYTGDIVIAGVGTLSFVNGILVNFVAA